jgi:hypothetical protein
MGAAPLPNFYRELNFCREQLAQVLVELANCRGISTEERKMAIDGLDRPEFGIRNRPPLGLAIGRREEHIRRHRHDKGLGLDAAQRGPHKLGKPATEMPR